MQKNNNNSQLSNLTEKQYLTQAQLGIYLECVKREGEEVYNWTVLIHITGSMDPERLAIATRKAFEAHPALFAKIEEDKDGAPMMKYVAPEVTEDNYNIIHTTEKYLHEHKHEIPKPFDLKRDRLFRVTIYVTEQKVYLCLDFHHIVSDGTTFHALCEDIGRAYRGEEPEGETVTGFDIAKQEIQMRSTEAWLRAKKWYHTEFEGVEGITILEPDIISGDKIVFGKYFSQLSVDATKLANVSKQLGTSRAALLYGAFGRVLGAYSGKHDVCFASVWHGRHSLDEEKTAMMMVKTIPVRCRYHEDTDVQEYLTQLKQQVKGARENDLYSFTDLCQDMPITDDVMFVYHGNRRVDEIVNGCTFSPELLNANETGIQLTFSVTEVDNDLHVKVEYCSNKYSEEYISRLVDSLNAVLCRFVETPHEKVCNISIVSESQQKELNVFHQVATYDLDVKTFHEGIERWAELTPDAVAIIATDRTLTYKEYNEAANRMARTLMSRGVGKEDRIVLLLPRTSNFLVALFAIMKCGAAYIPMDPAYPSDRITYILSDSDCRYVITTKEHVAEYHGKAINIDTLTNESQHNDSGNIKVEVNPHDLAYLIYTSGSTGRPKGVMLEHQGVANFFTLHHANYVSRAAAEFASVTLCQTTVSFDLSIFEYGTPLFNGKTVAFANEEEAINPFSQAELCKRAHVECISGTPSRLAMNLELNSYEEIMRTQIKAVMMGGEKLPWALVERLKDLDVTIVNGYGPTETTMGSSGAILNESTFVHVGKPAANYSYRILDNDLNELPVGVMGELCIGGISLARGYNKLPDKTASAFIVKDGERIYRTGDFARWTNDGNIIILGRTDNQVKLNGLRIELGEIETVMSRQIGIKQCVVIIKKIGGQEKIVAYYVCKEGESPEIADIKSGMAECLTHYMVPSLFVKLDKLPMTPAGKVDVKNLPEPELIPERTDTPESDEERSITEIVSDILGNSNFGVTTNLLSIGMTSLLCIRLSILIKKQLGKTIKVADIMASPTVRNIALRIAPDATPQESTHTSISYQNVDNNSLYRPNTPFFLTFAQTGVYLDCLKNPDTTIYNIPVLLTFPLAVTSDKLCDIITAVLNEHLVLFTRIMIVDDEPMMLYPKYIGGVVEKCTVNEADINDIKNQFVQPFNLTKGPLVRAKVVQTESHLYLFLDTHHLVSDGSSMAILLSQITGMINGKSIDKETCSYFTFSDRQHAMYESDDFQHTISFYNETMKDVSYPVCVPFDMPVMEIGTQQIKSRPIPSDLWQHIETFCKKNGITQAQYWCAVTAFVLGKYASTDNVYMCGISSGRQNLDIADTIGMFVNTLALHISIHGSSIKNYIIDAARSFSETLRHEEYPFSSIAMDYNFLPMFNYVYQLGLISEYKVGDTVVTMEGLDTQTPKFPISISVEYVDNVPNVRAMYDDAKYFEDTIDSFLVNMLIVASEIIVKPEAELNQITINVPERIKANSDNLTHIQPTSIDENSKVENDIEKYFCDIFADILHLEKVGVNDNFFELGGSSLIAVKVVIEAMNAGYKIDYKTVFDNPTPRKLATSLLATKPALSQTFEQVPNSLDEFSMLLVDNTLNSFLNGERQHIKGAIVTGATGYLGLHIVKQLLDRKDHPIIYCMVRANKVQTVVSRLRALLFYYFDDSYDELIGKQLFIVEGDVTNYESFATLPTADEGITHLFNCAANVKHFSAGTDIEDINVGGAKNCIDYCIRARVMMVHTSTYSVAGTTVADRPTPPHNINENELFWGQTLDNQYVRAKFEAEKLVLDAIKNKGLNGKIMRLGNLSARSTDGEYQVNFSTNSFMGRLRAFQAVGYIPFEDMSQSIEFSPINEVAEAVVLLSETPKDNIIFHPINANTQPYGNVINCLNKLNINIRMVERDVFNQKLIEAASDESKATILQSMLAYQTVADGKFVVFNGVNSIFTTQILMRLGFQWSFTTWDYIEKFINAIKGLGFFDEEYER